MPTIMGFAVGFWTPLFGLDGIVLCKTQKPMLHCSVVAASVLTVNALFCDMQNNSKQCSAAHAVQHHATDLCVPGESSVHQCMH